MIIMMTIVIHHHKYYYIQEQANAGASTQSLPPQVLEINPKHPLIVSLYQLKDDPGSIASLVAEQLLDNCLIAAGLVEDPRYMVPRLNELLLASTKQQKNNTTIAMDEKKVDEV